ncbi:MAG: hypothetical protein IKO16_06130 [Lachnospiraceae bacterium]|nr:hypothetical protein [Lachnospiraceae bacterium]
MKRKNIKNDKVLRAITIGLATMIAATSAPVNVWADDDSVDESSESDEAYDSEVGEAEQAAEETEESVESASESVSEAIEMITKGAEDVTVESANENEGTVTVDIDPASPKDGGAQAEQAVADFCALAGVTETDPATVVTVTDPVTNETSTITQAQVLADLATLPEGFNVNVNADIESDKTNTANESGETTDNKGLSVAADIEIVEAELKNADEASEAADDSAKEAAESVDSAADVVEYAKSSVAEAEAKAAPIITRIENAATADEVNAVFAELDKLTNDTKSDIDKKREVFNALKDKYEKAKKELTAKEAEYDRAVGHASAHVGYADKKLGDAQAYVNALSDACDKAKEKLGEEGAAAETIKNKQADVTKADWDPQKKLAKAIIDYYLIPQVLKGDHTIIEDINKIRTTGFDTQNGNSYRFEYTDSNGESHTLYFNYDRADREVKSDDQWYKNLGSAKEIIIYEKSEEEFRADEYLRKYYGTTANKLSYPEGDDYKKAVNRGDFAVYAYTDSNGNTQYICKAELEKSSDAKSKTLTFNDGKWKTTNTKLNITYDEESGKWSVNGSECRQVVQSVNSTTPTERIKINVAEDKDLQEFLKNAGALVDKYNAYSNSIDKAQTAVDTAKEATGALKEQIDALDKGKDDKKIARLEEIQGLIYEYDLMKYLSEEEQAALFTEDETSDMPALDPIGILDKILENLEKDLKDAENDLSKLIEQRDEIAKQIAEVQEENNDGDEEDETVTDDETATDDGTSADDDDDDDADAADDEAAAPAGFTFTGTPSYVTGTPAMTTLPGFGFTGDADGTGATGVLGVRTGGGNGAGGTEADAGGAADSRTNVAPRADFGTVNKVLGSRQNKDNSQLVKKIKDNEIPLAEIPNMDDEVTMNWMWLLIIFLLGATGKKMYDEYKKKKEAEEAAKINK